MAADVQQLIEGGGGAAPAPSQEAPKVSLCLIHSYIQTSRSSTMATLHI